jgi:hypothetical protein
MPSSGRKLQAIFISGIGVTGRCRLGVWSHPVTLCCIDLCCGKVLVEARLLQGRVSGGML